MKFNTKFPIKIHCNEDINVIIEVAKCNPGIHYALKSFNMFDDVCRAKIYNGIDKILLSSMYSGLVPAGWNRGVIDIENNPNIPSEYNSGYSEFECDYLYQNGINPIRPQGDKLILMGEKYLHNEMGVSYITDISSRKVDEHFIIFMLKYLYSLNF